MDTYLDLAENVLRAERRPLTPRAILTVAYRAGLVPAHVHGKTQHKTLGARLSEDLVRRSERSIFFRPAPGKFFLREFLTDTSIPEEHRRPIPTRRRFRDLVLGPALAVDKNTLARSVSQNKPVEPEVILRLLRADNYRYEDPRRRSPNDIFFRSFVCVRREDEILTYRVGRYREDRDAFLHRRSIGFSTFIHDFDFTLFSQADFGIVDSGVRVAKIDLDIPDVPKEPGAFSLCANLSRFIWASGPAFSDLLAVVFLECPNWFEPTKRRLALNDVQWLKTPQSINNLEDFDPWSQIVLSNAVSEQFRRECSAPNTPRLP